MMYSALSSNSSIVADMPRFSSTGLSISPSAAQQVIVLHVARADLQHVDVGQHDFDLRRVHHFADDEQAVFVGRVAHQLQALLRPGPESCRAKSAA